MSTAKSEWKHELTDNTKLIFQSYADSLENAATKTFESITINGGVILGGAAPPSGPLVGGICNFVPGSAVASTPMQIKANYTPPNFQIVRDNKTYKGSYTPWMKALTETIDIAVTAAFTEWLLAWNFPGAPIGVGGICAWVPSVPPAPGPWTIGTITQSAFNAPGFGVSASPAFQLLPDKVVASARAKMVTINNNTVPLCNTKDGENLIRAIAKGIGDGFDVATKAMDIYDPTGVGASGTAMPGGVIALGTISGCKLQ